MATEQQIVEGVNMLKVAFPNYQADVKATATLWMATLADLPGETLQAALMACITERGRAFAPSVGEIRDAAVRLGAQAAGVPSALEAYNEVIKMPADKLKRETMAVADLPESYGRKAIVPEYEYVILETPLEWSHPFVGNVAELIGWPKSFPTNEPGVDRAQFTRYYDSQLSRYLDQESQHPALVEYVSNSPAAQQIAALSNQKQLKG